MSPAAPHPHRHRHRHRHPKGCPSLSEEPAEYGRLRRSEHTSDRLPRAAGNGERMRRRLLLAPLLLFAVGCGVAQPSETEARDAAREVARKAGQRLYGQQPRTAEEVGRSASGLDGVEVLRVTGTSTHDGDGIGVVIRTSGSAYRGTLAPEEITVRQCFTVRVSPKSEWDEDPRDVDCTNGPALAFAPPPEQPRLPYEELRAKLPRVPEGGRADEADVRRTLAALDPQSSRPGPARPAWRSSVSRAACRRGRRRPRSSPAAGGRPSRRNNPRSPPGRPTGRHRSAARSGRRRVPFGPEHTQPPRIPAALVGSGRQQRGHPLPQIVRKKISTHPDTLPTKIVKCKARGISS